MMYEIKPWVYYERDKYDLRQPKQGWIVKGIPETSTERIKMSIGSPDQRMSTDKTLRQTRYFDKTTSRRVFKTFEEATEFFKAVQTAR